MRVELFSDRVVLGSGPQTMSVESALVVIEPPLIVEVARMDRAGLRARPVGESATRHDLGERLLSPAFINGHTHLSLCCLRGVEVSAQRGNIVEELYFTVEKLQTAQDVRAFARMGAYESLLSGVGTVWDHYYEAEEVAGALRDVGLCGVMAPTLQDLDGPGAQSWEASLETTLALHRDEGARRAGVVAALGPHATDTVSPELWGQIKEMADEHGLMLHAHVSQSLEEYQRSVARYGCSPIEWLKREGVLDAGAGMVLVHGIFVSVEEVRGLDPTRHTLGFCPQSQMQFCFPTNIATWLSAKVPVQIGTDCGACNDSMNVQQELRVLSGGESFATTHSRGYWQFQRQNTVEDAERVQEHRSARYDLLSELKSPAWLLSNVWSVPGQQPMGMPSGVIAEGMWANLALWDLNHPSLWPANDPLRSLAMSDARGALCGLMTRGEWIAAPGESVQEVLLDSDEFREARREASDRLDALLRLAGFKA